MSIESDSDLRSLLRIGREERPLGSRRFLLGYRLAGKKAASNEAAFSVTRA